MSEQLEFDIDNLGELVDNVCPKAVECINNSCIEIGIIEVFKKLNDLMFPINVPFEQKKITIFGKDEKYVYYTLNMEYIENFEIRLKRYIDKENTSTRDLMLEFYKDENKVNEMLKYMTNNLKQEYKFE